MQSEMQRPVGIDVRRGVKEPGTRLFSLVPVVLALALIWPFGGGSKKFQMAASTGTPAAHGTVTVRTGDNGNTRFDIKVQNLAKPSDLTSPENAYVVWVQPPEQAPVNEGRIKVNSNLDGQFDSQAPYQRFKLFITGEKDAQVQQPSGPQVLTADVTRG